MIIVVLLKDVKKMPLGKISKSQIAKGFEALEQIEDAVKNKKTSKLAELSSLFYTLIPHNFGRQRPPIISDEDTLRKKMDMLIVTSSPQLLLLKEHLKLYSRTKILYLQFRLKCELIICVTTGQSYCHRYLLSCSSLRSWNFGILLQFFVDYFWLAS